MFRPVTIDMRGRAVTHFALKDELLDAQALRAAGSAPYGGADLGECLAAAGRVSGTDLTSWFDAWAALAAKTLTLAEEAAAAGQTQTARLAFWRASSYFRTAGVMLMGAPADPRLVQSNARQTDAFRRGSALLASPPEILQIPFEDTTLPGYFFRSAGDSAPRATVILLGGYDGTAEELYFYNGAAALARGYHVLAFDGPGQGSALLQQGLVLRPDYENVVTPVLDYALKRADVDPDRVALIGLSLGAHLGPRAASAEHRLAACIADCGAYDIFQDALTRIPKPLAAGLADGHPHHPVMLRRLLDGLASKPTAGWALRRGLLVHGVSDPLEYLLALRDYSLRGRAEKITCPTFVCNAEADTISASAPQLVDALTGEKEFVTFTAWEGAADHCEAGARMLYHARSFGWLDAILHP
jgi:alpha-beta hydrolase superfamily lysophospholipase